MAPSFDPVTTSLSAGEQRVLAGFLAGRLPAGQVHTRLCRARAEAVAAVADVRPARRLRLRAAA